jgi:hypothetical protein
MSERIIRFDRDDLIAFVKRTAEHRPVEELRGNKNNRRQG